MSHKALNNKRIKNLIASALFAFIFLVPTVVRAEDDTEYIYQVGEQLETKAFALGLGNYTLTHEPTIDTLREGRSQYININLRAGISYGIVGVCDSDCADLDIAMTDERGNLIASDLEEDDIPAITLNPDRSGNYRIWVNMANCNSNTCYYGIGVFGR
ncbi:hypothetical protein [Nostoc sp. TCL26-01]|uniref:hypothetical protein n=1 Tax=Nostoc sp. TCL26-01 TaxID=2576904 RepID=UPI0015BAB198|nr:hypothetical protein [Nostoc sp. TCL26-01]QLE56496.1 hypothetical protein FD725_13805 [Nostoc sp. TCL26-01]